MDEEIRPEAGRKKGVPPLARKARR